MLKTLNGELSQEQIWERNQVVRTYFKLQELRDQKEEAQAKYNKLISNYNLDEMSLEEEIELEENLNFETGIISINNKVSKQEERVINKLLDFIDKLEETKKQELDVEYLRENWKYHIKARKKLIKTAEAIATAEVIEL